MKILILLAAVAAIVWAWRVLSRSKHSTASPAAAKEQNMVACAHCGLHVLQDEAFISAHQNYCCKEHAELGPRKH